jgi:acetylglutamate kinase
MTTMDEPRDAGLWVVKAGGRLCEEPSLRARLAAVCAAASRPLVLVHGGGDAVTKLQRALGVSERFVGGRRVTGEDELDAVEMMLSGVINKTMVRVLSAAGARAVGVSGCDAGMIRCVLVEGLGRVGVPDRVDAALPKLLLRSGRLPVVSPISLGPDGGAVNVNADEAAAALAVALKAERLLLLSDVEGVMVSGECRETIEPMEVEPLIAAGEATRGMIPKLRAAALAVTGGVGEARIAHFSGEPLEDIGGTRVSARLRESACVAPHSDIHDGVPEGRHV